jgi:hypothetical protein
MPQLIESKRRSQFLIATPSGGHQPVPERFTRDVPKNIRVRCHEMVNGSRRSSIDRGEGNS